jgi:peptidoglycan/xylan/chitin deacetylase (PgdA/CDA1 family)
MSDVVGALVYGNSLPHKAVLITFDDAYQDFAEHAWPILKQYNLPVTVFVPTGFPDQPEYSFWWDRLHAAIHATKLQQINTVAGSIPLATTAQRSHGMRKLITLVKSLPDDEAQSVVQNICVELNSPSSTNPVLSWDALRELAKEGVTLAPHTRRHPLLNRVGLDRAEEEIIGSMGDLRREIGDALPVLAYPSGAYSREVVQMLPGLGVQLAFTTCRGLNSCDQFDPFRLRRINIGRRTSPALMRAQLLPHAIHLNRWLPLPDGR